MKRRILYFPLFACYLVLLVSCNKQDFQKTTNSKDIHSLDTLLGYTNPMKIMSVNLAYNPKSNGYIKLNLENGDIYEAKSVDGGSFSSINSLLKEKEVLFDTIRKEVVMSKVF